MSEFFDRAMTFNEMVRVNVTDRWNNHVARPPDGKRAPVEERAAHIGYLDDTVDSGLCLTRFHGLFQPARSKLGDRGNQKSGVRMVGWRKNLVGRPLFDNPSRVENDDFVGKRGHG